MHLTMYLTMVRRVSGARALASLLLLSSFVQLSRAFGGISGRTAATSTASRTSGGRHHAHGGGVRHRSLSPVVGLPPRAQHGLRSEAGDGGQGGGGDGGMFGGEQQPQVKEMRREDAAQLHRLRSCCHQLASHSCGPRDTCTLRCLVHEHQGCMRRTTTSAADRFASIRTHRPSIAFVRASWCRKT